MKLNLARSWRSKTFDEMIGQDLAIRMLKNSLYSEKFFPVYLFSGQRGCGKTTAARIFAAAVNCEKLERFQKDPKNAHIPCLNCVSCDAMTKGQHPDFIEMDAASHTGVDHVRNIIDAASLLPVLGRKKVYLIDEAHMLSKAAFNAFLKLLEEPPHSVFFILATTDPQKIIETVLSRCFQLFFHPVSHKVLVEHLEHVCKQENILYDVDGLYAIANQSEGSVRDALNLLEQVRFSADKISQVHVMQVLGFISYECLKKLVYVVLHGSSVEVMQTWEDLHIEEFNVYNVWNSLIKALSEVVLYSLGAITTVHCFAKDVLKELVGEKTAQELLVPLDTLYHHELHFLKTTSPHVFLKYIVLKISQGRTISQPPVSSDQQTTQEQVVPYAFHQEQQDTLSIDRWKEFVEKIARVDDPLVASLFKRAEFIDFRDMRVIIQYPESLVFFKDMIESTKQVWLSQLHKSFGPSTSLECLFKGAVAVKQEEENEKGNIEPIKINEKRENVKQQVVKAQSGYTQFQKYGNSTKKVHKLEKIIDVSDTQIWKKAHAILEFFPGTVTEVEEDTYG